MAKVRSEFVSGQASVAPGSVSLEGGRLCNRNTSHRDTETPGSLSFRCSDGVCPGLGLDCHPHAPALWPQRPHLAGSNPPSFPQWPPAGTLPELPVSQDLLHWAPTLITGHTSPASQSKHLTCLQNPVPGTVLQAQGEAPGAPGPSIVRKRVATVSLLVS